MAAGRPIAGPCAPAVVSRWSLAAGSCVCAASAGIG